MDDTSETRDRARSTLQGRGLEPSAALNTNNLERVLQIHSLCIAQVLHLSYLFLVLEDTDY